MVQLSGKSALKPLEPIEVVAAAVADPTEFATVDAEGNWSGFPRSKGQSVSYWLQGVRCNDLLNHRTTPELPSFAHTVIIGSGITGSLVAKGLLETHPDETVLVLEAREFCSGATGRNAGHCKPDNWKGFTKYKNAFGAKQSLKILENEHDSWEKLVKYVHDNKVDCDLWVGDSLDVAMTPDLARLHKANYDAFAAAGGKIERVKVIQDPAEAAKVTRLNNAQSCYASEASNLYPWKLIAHVMRANLDTKRCNLQTYTQADRVVAATGGTGNWVVETSRGKVACLRVVHATNAYSAALEPSLRGLVRPTPHMCNKFVPPLTYSGSNVIRHSYGVDLAGGGILSVNPRCTSDGILLFGGSNTGQIHLNKWLEDHPERCTDDGFSGLLEVTAELQKFVGREFTGWADAKPAPGLLYDYSWCGIIGRTPDGVPLIGELPGLPGQWTCAGHNGHGMARIFTAAPGLVRLINGESWDSVGLPDAFQLTTERIQKLKEKKRDAARL